MPNLDGFGLLSAMSKEFPKIPVLVMTAFGTPDIEKAINDFGISNYLEKPIDFREFIERIYAFLNGSAKGFIKGITLPTFLQLIEMEKMTCTVSVKSGKKKGILLFSKGDLIDAEYLKQKGTEAALEILCWEKTEIELGLLKKGRKKRVNGSFRHIMFEALKRNDERKNGDTETGDIIPDDLLSTNNQKEKDMAVNDKLNEFSAIDGFSGVGVFTPKGETLALLEAPNSKTKLSSVGILANNILLNAQKATLEMGAGKGEMVHVVGEKAHILVRCLNEGNDPIESEPGKAHFHLVLVLDNDSGIGLAKMRIESIAKKLIEDFKS
jgi:predicted regulator of Ras-like GTPase activity (Roadblock/LC7/MglB family)